MRVVFYFFLSLLVSFSKNAYAKVIVKGEKLYVDFGSSLDYKFSHANNKKYFTYKYQNAVSIYSDVYFTGAYNVTSINAVGFSSKLWMRFNPSSDDSSISGLKIRNAYVFMESQDIGKVEFGIKRTVNNDIQISTSSDKFAVADGGVSGRWIDYANLHTYHHAKGYRAYYGTSINAFWVKPCLYSKYKWLKSPVISYYSPVVSGVQVGISYVPGESDIGYENLATGGISYSNKLFDAIDYSFSLTGELANAKPEKELNKLSAWNAGFSTQYKNVICLFSYGNIGKSGHISSHEAEYVNAGVAYRLSKLKSAITYFASNKGDYKLSSWGISLENTSAKNTVYYMDFIAFDAKQPAVESNAGTVFLAGIKFQF